MPGTGEVYGDDYRLLRPLGEGGMGTVWVAEQLSTGRERAVKLMHERFVDDAGLRERFVREARVGAMIDSEHVAEVLAAGVEADTGIPWMAMELLDGADLHDHVAKHGPMSSMEVLSILRQLCHALGAAHRVGVVHRDLKARNVFLASGRRVGDEHVVKVLDFGIAKLLSMSRRTSTEPLGSPGWMPPEQSDPKATILPAADVWSLGLLTFYLLTGKGFWNAQNIADASLEALLREVLIDPIPSAHRRSEELGADPPLDEELDAWFARCLAREPSDRFENADAAFTAFENLVEHGQSIAPPTGSARAPNAQPSRAPVSELPTTRALAPARRSPTPVDLESEPSTPSKEQSPAKTPPADDTLVSLSAEPRGRQRWVWGAPVVAVGAAVAWIALAGHDTAPVSAVAFDQPTIADSATATREVAPPDPVGPVPSGSAVAPTATAAGSATVAPTIAPATPRPAPSAEAIGAWRDGAAVLMGARAFEASGRCGDGVRGAFVTVEVTADGDVESIRASVVPGTANAATLRGCIEGAFRGLRFDPPGSAQTLTKGLQPRLEPVR